MKNPRKARAVALALMATSVLVVLFGASRDSEIIMGVGLIPMFAGMMVNVLFYRCPHCGEHLGRGIVEYCPHCGEKLDGQVE